MTEGLQTLNRALEYNRLQQTVYRSLRLLGVGSKKTHRVATVGFCTFKPQLACASVGLESVVQTQASLTAVVIEASCCSFGSC